MALQVPELPDDTDILTAALAYAEAGWYIVPTSARVDIKSPGSVLGRSWPTQSSRDPKQIAAWFAGTDYGIALHVGRSGGVVFDVDNPDELPDTLACHIGPGVPFQSTRPDAPGRGHHVFLQPAGRTLGNGTGRLGGAWGEVRGLNGVIIAAPTPHPDGGEYDWLRTGAVPTLAAEVAELLSDATESEGAVSDAVVAAFLDAHTQADRPGLLNGWKAMQHKRFAEGWSRYETTVRATVAAMEEAAAGIFDARGAADTLGSIYVDAATKPPVPGSSSTRVLTTQAAQAEMRRILRWAVAQALAADPAVIRARALKNMPAADEQPGRPAADMTDIGNANLLQDKATGGYRYCPETGRWLGWQGQRWQALPDLGEIRTLAEQVVTELPRGNSKGDDLAKAQARHYARSNSRRGLDDMVSILQHRTVMRVPVDRLDAHAYELNTPSGIVDLRTAAVGPSQPERFHTKLTGCGINFNAARPRWEAFLHQTFGGDQTVIDYLQRVCGLIVIGEVLEHLLPFLFGKGENGKTVIIEVLQGILGDYAIAAPANFLSAGRDKHETEIARLQGARLVTAAEVTESSVFDEQKVKSLTGDDTLTGRFMRSDFVDFKPSHTLLLMGNHRPEVRGGGFSFWRRVRMFPFNHTIPPEQRIAKLSAKLVEAEGPQILAWMVAGAVRYQSQGMGPVPAAISDATDEYADTTKSDVERFVDEMCITDDPAAETLSGAIHNCYQRWAKVNSAEPMTPQKFGLRLGGVKGVVPLRKAEHGRLYRLRVKAGNLP